MEDRITIHICSKDRHTELALVLQSLRTQTYQNWDLVIMDDASGVPIINAYFITAMISRLKLENHKVKLLRNNASFGCCYARNKCIEEDDFGNPLSLRLDDDILPEPNYIQKLLDVINEGYDMASGVIPHFAMPEMKREVKFVGDVINKHEFDKDGNLVLQQDDCGACYIEDVILPTHQFRTNCLYKSEINKKVKYPDNLTSVAFREEGFFSFGALLECYKIGVNTGAVCYHLQTPSGGNRRKDYAQCVQLDNETFKKWCTKKFKEKGNFLEGGEIKCQEKIKQVQEVVQQVQEMEEEQEKEEQVEKE